MLGMAAGKVLERLRGSSTRAVLIRGAGGSFVVQVTGTGIGFAVQVCLARWLGRTGFGDYVVAIAWLNILVLLGKLGFDTSALRFVAAYRSRGELGKLHGFLLRSHQIVLAGSLLLALVAAGTVGLMAGRLRTALVMVLLVTWLMLPLNSLLEVTAACLRGLRRVVLAQAPVRILRPLLLLAGVGLLVAWRDAAPTAAQAMAVHLAAVIASLALMFACLWISLPEGTRGTPPEFDTGLWCRVAAPLLLLSGLYIVLGQTDLLMLGAMRGSADAGVYGAAVRIAGLVGFGLVAVNMIAAPMISELYARGQIKQLQHMVRMAAWAILAFAVPATLGMMLGGKWILALFGSEFVVGYTPLLVLLGGRLVNALSGSVGFMMSMTGHQRQAATIVGISAVMNVVMNAALIPLAGGLGAAAATATTTVFSNLAMLIYVRRVLRINPTVLPMRASHP